MVLIKIENQNVKMHGKNQNFPRKFEIVHKILKFIFFQNIFHEIPQLSTNSNFVDNREIVRGQSLSMDNCP
jgi:hypothetical protein